MSVSRRSIAAGLDMPTALTPLLNPGLPCMPFIEATAQVIHDWPGEGLIELLKDFPSLSDSSFELGMFALEEVVANHYVHLLDIISDYRSIIIQEWTFVYSIVFISLDFISLDLSLFSMLDGLSSRDGSVFIVKLSGVSQCIWELWGCFP